LNNNEIFSGSSSEERVLVRLLNGIFPLKNQSDIFRGQFCVPEKKPDRITSGIVENTGSLNGVIWGIHEAVHLPESLRKMSDLFPSVTLAKKNNAVTKNSDQKNAYRKKCFLFCPMKRFQNFSFFFKKKSDQYHKELQKKYQGCRSKESKYRT
jgi:hypothetical protein